MYMPEGGRINSYGFWESATHRQCTCCREVFEKPVGSTFGLCRKCNLKRVKTYSPEFKMHQRAKNRAKLQNREFDLDFSDIIIPTTCPILGIPLVVHSGKSGGFPASPALDRIDSSKGYVKGNIQVISQRANQMKGDASKEELIAFAEWVLANLK